MHIEYVPSIIYSSGVGVIYGASNIISSLIKTQTKF